VTPYGVTIDSEILPTNTGTNNSYLLYKGLK
jgi:hypothetical protein